MYTVTWTIVGIISKVNFSKIGDARAKARELATRGVTATITNDAGKIMKVGKDSSKAAAVEDTDNTRYAYFYNCPDDYYHGRQIEIDEYRQNNNVCVWILNNDGSYATMKIIAKIHIEYRAY